jgi:hypothetical protein
MVEFYGILFRAVWLAERNISKIRVLHFAPQSSKSSKKPDPPAS